MRIPFFILTVLLLAPSLVRSQSFYRDPHGLFSTRPSEKSSLSNIKRFGPVGIGIDLIQPAFTMRISHVEEGSPAAATGTLEAGQIIETINGQTLRDIDPRIQLGQILAEAEATNGQVSLSIRNRSEPVTVRIPVLGAYSATWPLNCPKSDAIVRQVADYLTRTGSNRGIADIGMLFLLSTGEERDLEPVRQWAKSVRAPTYPWYLGYGGIPLCEYYLRTGDQEILPKIREWVDNAVKSQYLDGWMGRGGVSPSYGNGHLNAAGTSVVTFYLLARECGVAVPDHALRGALTHFFRYAGRGNNPYGDHRTELGFVDNGKNGKLAFAMAAAAALTPNGENSVYSAARDACAIQGFYTTSFMLHGHTGGGIGEIWRSAAMGLMHQKRPAQYRDFMDQRKWHYDLSRRFDGSFGILGGAGYDKEQWGIAYALTYTIPRRTLRISGAPRTKFSKPFQLPDQPWGTEADNTFLSLDAAMDATGHRQDLTKETLAEDSSRPVLVRLHESGDVGDDVLRRYVHHQDHNIRFVAASKTVGIHSGYIGWRSNGGASRPDLVREFLDSPDPRVRRAILAAVTEAVRREKRRELLTDSIFQHAVGAIENPRESWWVQDAALQLIGQAPAEWIMPHVATIVPFLDHRDWWLQNAALTALAPVVAEDGAFRVVLPPMGRLLQRNQRTGLTTGLLPDIRSRIRAAGPEVQELATAALREAYTGYRGVRTAPGGQDVSSTYDAHLRFIAESLADVPGGLDIVYKIGRERFPDEILPYKEFFLNAEPDRFGPELKQAIRPLILDELVPEFVGRNHKQLQSLAAAELQNSHPGGNRDSIDGLVNLYARAGFPDYGWTMFMDLRNAEWSYHSFDPIASEQVPFDQLITRYRSVTLPPGLENWFNMTKPGSPDVWKQGHSPFGQFMGRLPTGPIHKCGPNCKGPGCFGGTPVQTLWEKEVLLLHGEFAVRPLRDGYRYRLRVNDGDHVGSGGGHIVYINGKPLIETPVCNGRGAGGLPKGAYITREFIEDFDQETIRISVMTFLRYNDKYKVKPSVPQPQGKFSLHLEQQKLPPMGDDLIRKSAVVVPMLSSEWQAAQDPEDRERQETSVRFRYDGQFVSNARLIGRWQPLGTVRSPEEFDPGKRHNPRSSRIPAIHLRPDGMTDHPSYLWSDWMLMDLSRYEALQTTIREIDGESFLFIEAGGFSSRHPAGWQCQWNVFKRP